MLGIGFFEMVIIAVVCFVAIGPKELPLVMKKLAGFYRQFVLLKDEFRFQVMNVEQTLKKDIEQQLDAPPEADKPTKDRHG